MSASASRRPPGRRRLGELDDEPRDCRPGAAGSHPAPRRRPSRDPPAPRPGRATADARRVPFERKPRSSESAKVAASRGSGTTRSGDDDRTAASDPATEPNGRERRRVRAPRQGRAYTPTRARSAAESAVGHQRRGCAGTGRSPAPAGRRTAPAGPRAPAQPRRTRPSTTLRVDARAKPAARDRRAQRARRAAGRQRTAHRPSGERERRADARVVPLRQEPGEAGGGEQHAEATLGPAEPGAETAARRAPSPAASRATRVERGLARKPVARALARDVEREDADDERQREAAERDRAASMQNRRTRSPEANQGMP